MELQQILERYAEAIESVDASRPPGLFNKRTGAQYFAGFKSMNEEPAIEAVVAEWARLHPDDFQVNSTRVQYPDLPATAKADHVFTTDGGIFIGDEWGIEIKRLQTVGDNGKPNDYFVTKMLSPYLKDRGLLHDAVRLKTYGFTRRIAVVGYSFDYDTAILDEAEQRHPHDPERAVVRQIRELILRDGPLRIRPLMEFADAILGLRGLTVGPRAQGSFEAWTHPAGGRGTIFGWEIRRPELEPDYDPRHPW